MTKHAKIFLLLLLVCMGNIQISAQTLIHPKISFMGIHPFDEINSNLFDNRIDANSVFVIEPAVMVSIETMISGENFSWRIMPGFMSDAAAKPAFFVHLGLKLKLFNTWRHSFHVAAGGAILGRRLWSDIPGYIYESGYSQNGTWEYRLEPFGELEYNIFINKKSDITFSGIYGYQHHAFTFTVGYRFWLSTRIKHPRNCGSCPFKDSDKNYR